MYQQLWVIATSETSHRKYVTLAKDREDAKRKAKLNLGDHGGPTAQNPDTFICQPITNVGDVLQIDLTLFT